MSADNARPLLMEGPFKFFRCPCGHFQAINTTMPWCAACGIEYDIKTSKVVLRPERKTPRYAYGKAFNLAGGARIGGELERSSPDTAGPAPEPEKETSDEGL